MRDVSAREARIIAAAPLLAALTVLAGVFLTGFSQRSGIPAGMGDRFYGFFLDRYPLFTFAIVYGVVRLLGLALAPGRSSLLRRLTGSAIGLALLLAASLHPTFGGLILRVGYGTGSTAFLDNVPMAAAYLLGAGAAAFLFGLATGLGVGIIGRPNLSPPRSRLRRFGAMLLSGLAGFLALWFAAALIGLARDAGFGPWPRRLLDARDLVIAAALLTAAFLPHMLSVWIGLRPSTQGTRG